MQICGKEYTSGLIERIVMTIQNDPSISRTHLSKQICGWMGWHSITGKPQEVSCRKALLELDRRNIVQLPENDREYAFQKKTKKKERSNWHYIKAACSLVRGQYELEELGEIEIKPVSSKYSKDSKIWNWIMQKHHYLGRGPLCGAQIRYVVKSKQKGYLGALSFSASSWSVKSRDEYIGWSPSARRKNLQLLINNSRFLILPELRVKNLASYILSQSLQGVKADWEREYGYRPVMVESYVDGEYFNGTSYKASNWIYAGKTTGRRDKEKEKKKTLGKKDIYLYPLEKSWKEKLCKEKEGKLEDKSERIKEAKDWVEEEFCGVEIEDKRLERRLFQLGRDFYQQPGMMIAQACGGSKAKTKAAYRFFSNKEINMEKLLKPHIESTIERCKKEEVVLAVQDTTILDYTSQPEIEGLGPIGFIDSKKVGLILHDTIGFSTTGKPLGVLDAQCWARKEDERGKRYRSKQLPIEEKESIKWLNSYRKVKEISKHSVETKFISIGDREADVYELFYEALKEESSTGNKVELLIRACRNRKRQTEGEMLWERMQREELSGYMEIQIPRKTSRAARKAKLAIRYAKLKIQSPKKKHLPEITLWAIYLKEVESKVKEPLEWMLLTTIEIKNFEDACQKIIWYSKRWGIEQYHKTLKSGARIEDRQLEDADRIRACLAIDMVIAWRVYYLTTIARDRPLAPCTEIYDEYEWKATYWYMKKTQPPEVPPTLNELTTLVGNLGGYLGRNSDGPPGITVVWRGLIRVRDISVMYKTLTESLKSGP